MTLPDGARLVAVADGIGGQPAGDRASQWAMVILGNEIRRRCCFGSLVAPDLALNYEHLLGSAFKAAAESVHGAAECCVPLRGAGTTLTAAIIEPNGTIHIRHTGDSRAFIASRGGVRPLTADHGEGHRLHRWLGYMADPSEEGDAATAELRPGELLILASDGAHMGRSPEEQAEVLAGAFGPGGEPDPRKAVEALLERRGGDDATAAAVGMRGMAGDV